jgi:hypothetical protein
MTIVFPATAGRDNIEMIVGQESVAPDPRYDRMGFDISLLVLCRTPSGN